ncbi:MAG: hypothetical protein ABIJ09_02155 [Pseudomonadota bacterium]
MARIARSDVNAALMRAAKQIEDAAGPDGRVSRADIKAKLQDLKGTERNLVDIFFKFIDHRDHVPGAVVTKKDIDKAVAYAKDKLINQYDLNNNGLSKSEIDKMSTTGKLAVQLAMEMRMAAAIDDSGVPPIAMRYGIMPPTPEDPAIALRYGIMPPSNDDLPIVMRYGIRPHVDTDPGPAVRYGFKPPVDVDPAPAVRYGIMPEPHDD